MLNFLCDFNTLIKTKLSHYYQISNTSNKFDNILSFKFLLELSKLRNIISKFITEIPHYTSTTPLHIHGLYLNPILQGKRGQSDDTIIFSNNTIINKITEHSNKISDNFNQIRLKRKKVKHTAIAGIILLCTLAISSSWMVALNKNY
ncbi:hypothetical protein [Piscirickettsia litoralis]|uniref:Uncharacterized protein n=1 Tax=Piscirickettsia litoralis TaxID=1891921 RepID=A0ABX3A4E5_9GAMM|nr:hypothetical protein [Piscirickettsia litoralis]ODN42531.1 hypothetical protein BGC07_05810 [Piscirickettsia litoralis]